MAFSTAGGSPFQAEINITPMIDVLLVLIIVFMVVVSMSQEKGLEAQIPQPAEKPLLFPFELSSSRLPGRETSSFQR